MNIDNAEKARLELCIIPQGGAVWVTDDKHYAKIQVKQNSNLNQIKWLAYDVDGNDVSENIKINFDGVNTKKLGKYNIVVVCDIISTNVEIEVIKKQQRPFNLEVIGLSDGNPKRHSAESGFNPIDLKPTAIDALGKNCKVIVSVDSTDTSGNLTDGEYVLTWINSGVPEQTITAVVTVGEVLQDDTFKMETTDGLGSYGNPPRPPQAIEPDINRTIPGEGLPDVLLHLKDYEIAVHTDNDISTEELEEWQLYLYRYMRKLMTVSSGFNTFTLFLDRCNEMPEVYSELNLTRVIGNMVPHSVPEWYFKLLWLISRSADPVNRVTVGSRTNYNSLLQGIPNPEMDFITQYFASVAVVTV